MAKNDKSVSHSRSTAGTTSEIAMSGMGFLQKTSLLQPLCPVQKDSCTLFYFSRRDSLSDILDTVHTEG